MYYVIPPPFPLMGDTHSAATVTRVGQKDKSLSCALMSQLESFAASPQKSKVCCVKTVYSRAA